MTVDDATRADRPAGDQEPSQAPVRPTAKRPRLEVYADARLPTRWGEFRALAFRHVEGPPIADFAVVRGPTSALAEGEVVQARVHSECVTGEVFGSLRCDCRDQLELALERMAAGDVAVLLYLRQEGRGIGLGPKLRAYQLQDEGMDTVEANLHLGFDDDLRSYEIAAAIFAALDVGAVELWTNNPHKVEGLRAHGVDVVRRVPIEAVPGAENAAYLATKRERSGHLLGLRAPSPARVAEPNKKGGV